MTKRVGRAEPGKTKGVREMNNQMNVGLDSDRVVWENKRENVWVMRIIGIVMA